MPVHHVLYILSSVPDQDSLSPLYWQPGDLVNVLCQLVHLLQLLHLLLRHQPRLNKVIVGGEPPGHATAHSSQS